MVTLTRPGTSQADVPRAALWLAAVGALVVLLVSLSIVVIKDPTPANDLAVLEWVAGWDFPGLGGFFAVVSFLTSAYAGLIYGPGGIAFLLLRRQPRAALAFGAVGAVVAFVAALGDYTLGEAIGRARPLGDNGVPSFPSGHVFGSTVLFGFSGFLAIHYGVKRKLLTPFILLLVGLILAVGPARLYEKAHWPTDVAAGYLLAALWLLVLVPLFLKLKGLNSGDRVAGTNVATSGRPVVEQPGISETPRSGDLRTEHSIASVVVLDSRRGTATKTYSPPAIVRGLYWLAFQAPFPYVRNPYAFQAAVYRRQIAGFLTKHRFGKNLVAPVIEIKFEDGQHSLVTEFVPGEVSENSGTVKEFLSEVAATFAEAGLSVWQVDPKNPHAHTNLIRTSTGDLKIIDLESAIVTPLTAPSHWRQALRSNRFPIFDDIDTARLRRFVTEHRAQLETSLGSEGVVELCQAVDRCEHTLDQWKYSEPRIWGRLASRVYRALDWTPLARR